MKWICTALTVTVLGVAHVVAQDLFVTLPAVPTKNPLEGNADAITAGMGAYRVRCADCHGMDARGIRAPDITQVWAKGRTDDGALSNHSQRRTRHRDARVPGSADLRHRRLADSRLPEDDWPHPRRPSPPRGNAGAGENVFVTNCLGCHRVGERGGHLGPDLSRIGTARARAAMARQIRGTVADFRTGYEPVTLTTPGGQQIRGVKKNEDLFSVQIMDTRERIQGYLREDMRAVTNEKQSAMPTFGSDRLSDAAARRPAGVSDDPAGDNPPSGPAIVRRSF